MKSHLQHARLVNFLGTKLIACFCVDVAENAERTLTAGGVCDNAQCVNGELGEGVATRWCLISRLCIDALPDKDEIEGFFLCWICQDSIVERRDQLRTSCACISAI